MSQHFLHYIITNTLAQHKASTTYLALQDKGPARTVVLKIFHEPGFENKAAQEKFMQEVGIFGGLRDAQIVPIIEASAEKDQAYIVSGYLPNGSLRLRLERAYLQRLPIQQAISIIAQVGQGLAYLHERSLIHGQLKPEHILFDARGHALLADPYCSTRPAPWDSNNDHASESYRYLAPEQFAGKSSPFSDQYALCCIAYELLVGYPPFTLKDPQALKEQQQSSAPSPLSAIVADIPMQVEQAILKGLAKEPAHRHADMMTFLSELQATSSSTHPALPLARGIQMAQVFAASMALVLARSVQHTLVKQEKHDTPSLNNNPQLDERASLSEAPTAIAQKDVLPPSSRMWDYGSGPQPSLPKDGNIVVPSQPEMPEGDLVAVGMLTAIQLPSTQAPSEPVMKAKSTKNAAHMFAASLAYMQGRAFSKRTALGALLILVMVVSLVLYSTFAVAATKSSSSAMLAIIAAQTPASTADALEILPPAIVSRQPKATATSKSTPMPKPSPTPKPKPSPTPIPTPSPTPIPTPSPTPIPTPTVAPATPTAAPTPTPTPTPNLLYSQTIATQSTRLGTVMLAYVPNVVVTDMRIEADIVIQGNVGGVLFRSGVGQNYTMRIGTDGSYDLENASMSLARGASPAIRRGNNVSNHVTIVAKGSQITVAVNGTPIINLQDGSSSYGTIGVLAADFGLPTTATCVLTVYRN